MPNPTKSHGEVRGKVLQAGVREGTSAMEKPYAYAWVQLLESGLREIVEIAHDVTDGRANPFAELQRGQFVTLPVGQLRMSYGVLKGSLAVEEAAEGDAGSTADADEVPF